LIAYFDDAIDQFPLMINRVFNIRNSSKAFEEFSGATGISKLIDVGENGAYVYQDELEDYLTRLTPSTWKRGIQVSKEQNDDNQYRSAADRTKSLARALTRTLNSEAYSVFRNSFSTSYTSYGNAKPLISTLHPSLSGGSVRSNASATSIPLSEGNLETGLLAIREVLDHQGELQAHLEDRYILMVPPALEKLGFEMIKSQLKSNSQNNDVNYFEATGTFDLFINPWISALAGGSDTAWFLVKKSNRALQFLWRENPNYRIDTDDETDALKFKVRARWQKGWLNPIGEIWGSKGTNAAYAS